MRPYSRRSRPGTTTRGHARRGTPNTVSLGPVEIDFVGKTIRINCNGLTLLDAYEEVARMCTADPDPFIEQPMVLPMLPVSAEEWEWIGSGGWAEPSPQP